MEYRKFGKLDVKVSALGFGTMRLPTDGNVNNSNRLSKDIVEAEAIKMIRNAIDQGVNYIDTAYPYHGGNSEIVTGKALKDGYREKVMLATKSPTWLINKPEDFDRILDEQLQKLQTDCIDFYLLHALSGESYRNVIVKHEIIKRAEEAKKVGKIKYIGFSFHDNAKAFIEIVDGYDKWDFCQIQYNYMDIENQAGLKGLKYAASKGIGVVIMEPLLGGRLANPPKDIRIIMDQNKKGWTPSYWALQWLWNQSEVSVILSGMSNMQQVEENIASANRSGVGLFGKEELDAIDLVRQKYNERAAIPCTGCSYCMPCPNNVNIPRNFELYNESIVHEDIAGAKQTYHNFFDAAGHAIACIQCKICEEKCPQRISISEWMPKVHNVLGR
ncbi:aldo/keto reductase [Clostridium sp. BNL1100]|uniref:aldo/keto reductase n=1 Tax=Clostridium sp. BNL1100 TaxID=755731 RepID=UPI00024A73F1|nr:aldo/keto reductase [Clostridium sp. BNL1100]AEY66834.1 putative oxidoreductase of aldo/keto reductase family [Clostridium sp. BNL1100]